MCRVNNPILAPWASLTSIVSHLFIEQNLIGKPSHWTGFTPRGILLGSKVTRWAQVTLFCFVSIRQHKVDFEHAGIAAIALRRTQYFGCQTKVTFFGMPFKWIKLQDPTILAVGKLVVVLRSRGNHQFLARWAKFAGGAARCILVGTWQTYFAGNGGRNLILVSPHRAECAVCLCSGGSIKSSWAGRAQGTPHRTLIPTRRTHFARCF